MKLYPQLSKGRYESLQSEIEAAKRSLYFVWWKYLRLSEDYWWICRFKGVCKDKALCETYKKFGDIFSETFEEWWMSNGEKLFSFKVDPPKVELLEPFEFRDVMSENYEVLLVPKYLTKSQIASQVRQIIASHKPSPLPKKFKYDVAVSDTRGMKRDVLKGVYDVWCLNQVLQDALERKLLHRPERFTQYWIGKKLELMKQEKGQALVGDAAQAAHRLAVRVKVNRYLAKARALIANAELGNFPVVTPVETRERWTKKQQALIESKQSRRRWMSPEIDESKFNKMLGL